MQKHEGRCEWVLIQRCDDLIDMETRQRPFFLDEERRISAAFNLLTSEPTPLSIPRKRAKACMDPDFRAKILAA